MRLIPLSAINVIAINAIATMPLTASISSVPNNTFAKYAIESTPYALGRRKKTKRLDAPPTAPLHARRKLLLSVLRGPR